VAACEVALASWNAEPAIRDALPLREIEVYDTGLICVRFVPRLAPIVVGSKTVTWPVYLARTGDGWHPVGQRADPGTVIGRVTVPWDIVARRGQA
jgi:hypothetical protein